MRCVENPPAISLRKTAFPLLDLPSKRHGHVYRSGELRQSTANLYCFIEFFVHKKSVAQLYGKWKQKLIEGGFALPKIMLHDLGVPEGQGRIIHAKGNSMAPTIQDRAVVLINLADKEPMMSKVYAVCLPHEGLVLKRLTYEYNEAAGTSVWMMKSDNPDKNQHPDRRLPPDESTIIVGRAVWYGNRL